MPNYRTYEPEVVNALRKRLWNEAFTFARELRRKSDSTLSGLELLTALHIMIEETHHHWIEDDKKWNDILAER